MRSDDSGDSTGDLDSNVGGNMTPGKAAGNGVGNGDSGVEVRARDVPKGEDKGDKRSSSGDGVTEEGKCNVAASEAVGHDSRADHGGEQQHRANEFSDKAAWKCVHYDLPISLSFS
jgi:hypothetical protein